MEFLDSLQQVKQNWEPYKKWEKEQDNKEFQRQELHKQVQTKKEDLEKAAQYGRTVVDAINVMDQYSINKAEDVEAMSKPALSMLTQAGLFLGAGLGFLGLKTPMGKKYLERNPNKSLLVIGIPAAIMFVGSVIWGNIVTKHYEKQASRIARFQARENELQDSRNFVIYDNAQIEKAKEIAKTLPEIVDKNKKEISLNPITTFNNSIKSIMDLKKDSKNYDKWKQDHIQAENNKQKTFEAMKTTPEQIEKAKKERDNLLSIVKKIEIYSQNYLSNVEMAINSMIACDFVGGAIGGAMISGGIWLLQKTKVLSKNSHYANMLKALTPILAPMVLIIATSTYAIQAQKESARIGRFKAKQDLLKDPHNFVVYDDKQTQSLKNIKAPDKKATGFFGKLKEEFNFFIQLRKDFKEYKEYEKTKGKEDLKLQEALKKVEVTETQKADAKSLQKNAFHTFEKMDEMTQRYSDDIEGATEIVKVISALLATIGAESLSLYLMMRSFKKNPSSVGAGTMSAMIPMILASCVNIPLEIQSIRIKKEAGRIGLMKAMQDLDDPRNFIDNNSAEQKQTNAPQTDANANSKSPNTTNQSESIIKKAVTNK